VVVVSINYRLGALGFYAAEELVGRGGGGGTGAMNGVHDQIVALTWVSRHIRHFGGDASQITVFGESAGSLSTCMLVTSPLTKGLFRRAVLQSGACTRAWGPDTRQAALEASATFAAKRSLAAMRKVQPSALLEGWPGYQGGVDGWVLPRLPRTHFRNGLPLQAQEIILGHNSYDGIETFILPERELGQLAYQSALAQNFGESAASIEAVYPPSRYGGNRAAAIVQSTGDCDVVCPSYELARWLDQAGTPVFVYHFRYGPVCEDEALQRHIPTKPVWAGWASHAAEIAWVFGTNTSCFRNASEHRLTAAMQGFWGSFARAGESGWDGRTELGTWTRWRGAAGRGGELTMVLDLDFRMQRSWKHQDCSAIQAVCTAGP
jgi:para-nitrobenzyl esterase